MAFSWNNKNISRKNRFQKSSTKTISVWCFMLIYAESRRHTCCCVILYVYLFHSSWYSRTIDLLTKDVTHTLDTFKKGPFSTILRIITLGFPILIYISHDNLRINGNKPILYCALSVNFQIFVFNPHSLPLW